MGDPYEERMLKGGELLLEASKLPDKSTPESRRAAIELSIRQDEAEELETFLEEAKRRGFIALLSVLVCTRCGSRVDYGAPVGNDGRCYWCPACSPELPWRRGTVVEESAKAREMRK